MHACACKAGLRSLLRTARGKLYQRVKAQKLQKVQKVQKVQVQQAVASCCLCPVAAGLLRLKRLLLLVSAWADVPGAPSICRAAAVRNRRFESRRHLEDKVAPKMSGFYRLRTGPLSSGVLPLLAAFMTRRPAKTQRKAMEVGRPPKVGK